MQYHHAKQVFEALSLKHAIHGVTSRESLMSMFAVPVTNSMVRDLYRADELDHHYLHDDQPYFIGRIVQMNEAPTQPVLLPHHESCYYINCYHNGFTQQSRWEAICKQVGFDVNHRYIITDEPALDAVLSTEEALLSKLAYSQILIKNIHRDLATDTTGQVFATIQLALRQPKTPVVQVQLINSHFQWAINLETLDEATTLVHIMLNEDSHYDWASLFTYEGYC